MKGKILVLGTDSLSFLAVIRSLGRQGYEVHTTWADPGSPALSSRYVSKNHDIARYDPDGLAWADEFERLLYEEHFDLVVPCSDPMIIPLRLERERFERFALITLLPDDVWTITSSKILSHELALRLGVPVARSSTVSGFDEAVAALDLMDGPWVFKPMHSFTAANLKENNCVAKAFSRASADNLAEEFAQNGPFQIQENFRGKGTGVEVLCKSGEILLAFQHLRVHEPMHGGAGTYRKGIPLHGGMLSATKEIMRHLNYTGVAMVEYKWDQDKDKWIFVEINARFWGSLPLAVASGADFPAALVGMLLDGKHDFSCKIRSGMFSRNLSGDFEWLLANCRADHHDPNLSSLPWRTVLKEIVNIITGKERWDTLTADDPLPFIVELRGIAKNKFRSLRRKLQALFILNPITRYFRNRRLRRAIKSAKSIGFICYGNICRSPFAEVAAANYGLDISLFSGGFHEPDGRVSPKEAISAARHFGVDLTDHRSRTVTIEQIEETDMIFIFDKRNYDQFLARFPQAKGRLFWISDLTMNVPAIIADPYGLDISGFRENYSLINECISILSLLVKKVR